MYVFMKAESGVWTTGFYSPSGKWHSDSDFNTKEGAAERVHYLNGGELPYGEVYRGP